MTKGNTKTAILALLIAGIAVTANAQDTTRPEKARGAGFAQIDADQDGRVTEAEMIAMAEARFAARDANGDGVLSSDEILAERRAKQSDRATRMIERLDSDGDNALSFAEISERRDPAELFARLDANEDGAVSEEEFAALKKMRGHRGADRDGHSGRGHGKARN
ncbi:EF hand [Roseivivax sp. THAF40]|uniref:EF-hand domain-containing protein n=1 Tax=unclassified Roseivivax TaxID=2639302 RepID=UPI0012682BCF|nr:MULTISPECIES: EF-hand domain-containing protein [unclassified Roseivivax]QFS81687.1 EF hand [Roseivivax sp. THAF197b]QFT45479.1 EF hand [Roseivivax sp. THAF40]